MEDDTGPRKLFDFEDLLDETELDEQVVQLTLEAGVLPKLLD